MKSFLFILHISIALSFVIPIPTNSERCMIIYSINHEDTVKITIKFPQDKNVVDFYDYLATIRDLQGNTIREDTVMDSLYKT